MMSVQSQYNDNGYKNWLQSCLGLKYMKEGILDFVDAEVKQFHAAIITKICRAQTCNQCSTNHVIKKNHRCPNNICDSIRREIEQKHRFGKPCWQNSDATKWCTDYWEIGKCFMSQGCATTSTAAETDCSGLLSICISGLFLPPTLKGQIIPPCIQGGPPVDIFHKNREARNALLHSGTMSLTGAERQAYIQDMICLLNSYTQQRPQVTNDAICSLTQLNTNIFITSTDEIDVLKIKVEATNALKAKVDCNEISIQATKDDITELKSKTVCSDTAIQTTNDDMNELKTKVDRSGTAIQSAEGKIDALEAKVAETENKQQELKRDIEVVCSDTTIQTTRTKDDINELRTKVDRSGTAIQSAEGNIDALEARAAQTENKQQELKRDTEEQWQRQKQDTSRIEAQLKKNSESSALVDGKLDMFQCKIEEEITELKSNIDVQGRLHGVRVGKIEDEVAELRKDLDAARGEISPENADWDKTTRAQDVKNCLVAKYERDELTIPMSPLLRRISANVDDVYMELTIRDDLVHKQRDQMNAKCRGRENANHVKSYQDVLHDGNTSCRNIYVVGKAGVGKTTWSRKFVATWIRAIANKGTYNVPNENETVLQEYDLVFRIDLRHARGDTHIMQMIDHQLLSHAPDLLAVTKSLMDNPDISLRCIILLDGLDEWLSHESLSSSDGLPLRDPRWQTTFITTTRSWKLEALQLEAGKIDRAIEIQGLQQTGVERLIAHVVSAINKNTGANKHSTDFRTPAKSSIRDCMNIPLLLIIFVCLWYETNDISQHLAGLYSGLVNMLIQYAEGNTKTRLFQKILPLTLHKMKEKWKQETCSIADCLPPNTLPVPYLPFLQRLGKLAFNALFAKSKECTLVFDYQSIENALLEDELDLAVNIGILSQTMQPESVLEQQFILSFLHKTLQEYLATLYMVCGDDKANCLKRYKTYCGIDIHRILEMENIVLFLSGLCPEMAAEIQCHIANTKPDSYWKAKNGRELLTSCLREEHALSTTTDNNHILYVIAIEKRREKRGTSNNNPNKSKSESIVSSKLLYELSSELKRVPIESLEQAVICHYNPSTESESESSGHTVVRIVQYQECSRSLLVTDKLEEVTIQCYSPCAVPLLDMSGCTDLRKLKYMSSCIAMRLPTEHLEEVVIENCSPSTGSMLDMSGCKVLRKLKYLSSSIAMRLPTESLEELVIQNSNPSSESVLDMSGCKTLRKLEYTRSSIPIRLPTESLKEVVIQYCNSSSESVLDMSGCKVLRKIEYTSSSIDVRLPIESLEEAAIQNCNPSTKSVFDMSMCEVLRKLEYRQSSIALRLPIESLKEVVIQYCDSSSESVLDILAGCNVLRKLEYSSSSVALRLPTENLEEVVIQYCDANSGTVFDMSGCKVLRKLQYTSSSIAIRLATESLKEAVIQYCDSSSGTVLDMSGCKVLSKLQYTSSSIAIRLATESLGVVVIKNCRPSTEAVLDMSGCKVIRKLEYTASSIAVRLPTESLEELVIRDCEQNIKSMLDMSECKALRKLQYRSSSIAIELPTESMEEVVIQGCSPSVDSVIDMSRCTVLRKLEYILSTITILLPTKSLKEVVIKNCKFSTESVLDMSGCMLLRKLKYISSSRAIRLPPESIEIVIIKNCEPSPDSVLDMSGCKVLRKLVYMWSSIDIRLPTASLEEAVVRNYWPRSSSVFDMSGCKVLRKLKYKWSSTAIRLPTESLEEVVIQNYWPTTESVLDMSGCKVLKKFEYRQSHIAVRLPTEIVEEVIIQNYEPNNESLLDLSGCKVLRKLEYSWSRKAIRLPTESLEEVVIQKYEPTSGSELDMTSCKVLRKLECTRSSITIKLPTEKLEEVVIYHYKPIRQQVLDMSGCEILKKIEYHGPSTAIRLPTERLEEVVIHDYKPSTESVLDMSGCKVLRKVQYSGSSPDIRLPNRNIKCEEITNKSR